MPDATGDALVATNPGWSRVAKGTAGQVLRSNGTTLVTANPRNEDLTTAYRFRAHMSTDQAIASGSFVVANFDTVDFDDNSNFDTTNHRWTVPVTGYYLLVHTVHVVDATLAAATLISLFFDNGAGLGPRCTFTDATAAATTNSLTVTTIEKLTAGHTIDVRVFQNTGVNQTLEATATPQYSEFSGHLLSV